MKGALARAFSSRETTPTKNNNASPQGSMTPQEDNNFPKHVIIFMDAMEKFSIEPLEWVLKNVVMKPCCTLTIIGIYPYLNIPQSAKTWSGIWSVDCEDLQQSKEKGERRSDPKHLKVQFLMDLCESYGVSSEIRTEMGHPLRRRVMEIITSLQATLVVFDKHHDRKNIEYYAEKVPYNMIIMNENGEVDMIKGGKSQIDSINSTAEESPHSIPPTPKLKISGKWKKFLYPVYRRIKVYSTPKHT